MGTDPSAIEPAVPLTGPQGKVRLHFRKDGALRWLSHHDLMRTFERLLRRSLLPFRSSQGFNPRPKLVFALPLPVGVIGCDERVDLELNESLAPEEVRDRLNSQSPPGLHFHEAFRVPPRSKPHVVGLTYAVVVPPERRAGLTEALPQARSQTTWVVHRERPQPRQVDIRPFVRSLDFDEDTGRLIMNLAMTSSGTARPEEVLGMVGLADLWLGGSQVERLALELAEEAGTPGEEGA